MFKQSAIFVVCEYVHVFYNSLLSVDAANTSEVQSVL